LKQLQERPPAPQTWRADLPPAVDMVLQKALGKSPADRYPSVEELSPRLTLHCTSACAHAYYRFPSPPTRKLYKMPRASHSCARHADKLPSSAVVPPSAIAPLSSVSGPPSPIVPVAVAQPPAATKPTRLHRTVETLGSVAQVLAPLIGREKVPVSTKADDRRTAIALADGDPRIFLAVLQFISTALDLVTAHILRRSSRRCRSSL